MTSNLPSNPSLRIQPNQPHPLLKLNQTPIQNIELSKLPPHNPFNIDSIFHLENP